MDGPALSGEQRRVAALLREQHVADERRRACKSFLEHAERYRDCARAYVDVLEHHGGEDAITQARLS